MATAECSITVQGSAEHTVIISGDGNHVCLGHQEGFAFRLLDQDFCQVLELREQDSLTCYHFDMDCLLPQGKQDEACRHMRRALEPRPRKARDRERIQAALRRHCR